MPGDPPRGVPRREFVRSSVAIGGAAALAACVESETETESEETTTDERQFPQGPADPSVLPERQHAWNEFLVTDPNGDTVLPRHQVLLLLEYTGSVPPSDGERSTVEGALRTVERAFERGTGGDAGATFNRGLLFTLGYAPGYFDRFDASLPTGLDLPSPDAVVDELDEDAAADDADALLVLVGDYGSVLLGAEAALTGETETVNGVDVEATLADVFDVVDRRTGVVGRGLPAEKLDRDAIADDAPLSMGYKSGYADTNPAEDRVTIEEGPFAGGTTQLASRLTIDLDRWYELNDERRAKQMFSTDHDAERVGSTGEALGSHSGIEEASTEDLEEKAAEHGCLGHGQKTARARDEEFRPRILRRSESVATDPGSGVGMNFTSVQRGMEPFLDVRRAMNDDGGDIEAHRSGIVDFLEAERRATFLVPPRSHRALPTPRPE